MKPCMHSVLQWLICQLSIYLLKKRMATGLITKTPKVTPKLGPQSTCVLVTYTYLILTN